MIARTRRSMMCVWTRGMFDTADDGAESASGIAAPAGMNSQPGRRSIKSSSCGSGDAVRPARRLRTIQIVRCFCDLADAEHRVRVRRSAAPAALRVA